MQEKPALQVACYREEYGLPGLRSPGITEASQEEARCCLPEPSSEAGLSFPVGITTSALGLSLPCPGNDLRGDANPFLLSSDPIGSACGMRRPKAQLLSSG
ncbi:hypothetical protein J1605_013929 [Eschrichtius robustus]|uniref:Uncharacterized protein n=1 Tax=Eschrichtius robustus TaxID=9764 RepID=A0AB34GI45_ESCRO|nr:hypothetical protein J1605_013929 [Eschrichtius robustus]